MSLEFNFFVRDGLFDFFQPEELNKLEITDFPYTHTKEVVLDIIVYCALGDLGKPSKKKPCFLCQMAHQGVGEGMRQI